MPVRMPSLLMVLMVAALSAEVYTRSCQRTSLYAHDPSILRVLDGGRQAPAPPSARRALRSAGGILSKASWWKLIFPLFIGKRQDVSTYNVNSFGLRYGK
uniref:Secreted protein n=1 Tax=Salarias fasciatus TaxID=181472 RepID=A0A672IVV2_SALFA